MIFDSNSKVTEISILALLPFATTCLRELGFSCLLQIKTKQRSGLEVENDLRCALSSSPPRIQALTKQKQ